MFHVLNRSLQSTLHHPEFMSPQMPTTTESVTNSTIAACFLSNITLLNYSSGIHGINMCPGGSGFNLRPPSHWGLKRRALSLHDAMLKVSNDTDCRVNDAALRFCFIDSTITNSCCGSHVQSSTTIPKYLLHTLIHNEVRKK